MTNSAAGEDGIQLIALKNLSDDATKQLFNLLEDMAENSPDTWDELARSRLVVPIFKKGDRKSLDNYRGVCLLSAISRILARIMATRIRKWTEEENIIDDTQCGFRKGRSTADATQIVIRVNEEVLRRRGPTEVGECSQSHPTATLLDITKAYPRVNRPLLWYILERLGFGERSLRIIRGLHETTFYRVKGKKEVSSPWTPMRDLREGCATSPVLFNIYHNVSMRMATRERDPNSGIRWKWIKGNSFPPINIRSANTSTNTEECRLQSILFADDTTVFGTRDQMEKEKRIVKANMRRLEEKCHDGKEETLLFGERKSQDIRILGSYVGRATDLAKRKERGNKALWTTKRRLKGSTLPKKLQARIVDACVESTILFDCQTRPWRDREINQLQRIADQGYTYIWRHKNGGPTKMQMERRATNLYGVRRALGIKSIRQKIEKRSLERMGHVFRMPNGRITKQITLGWYPTENDDLPIRNHQTTLGYWRKLVREMGLETHNVDRWTDDRKEWKEKVRNRMTEIEKWEDTMADSHKGAKIAGPKDRKRTASKSLSCNWEECDKQCKTLAGLKAHQRRIHSKSKETRRTCEKCQQSFSDHQARVNHGKICQGQEKGTCPYCQKRLLPSNMARHKKTCKKRPEEKEFSTVPKMQEEKKQCSFCGTWITGSNLARHERQHRSRTQTRRDTSPS